MPGAGARHLGNGQRHGLVDHRAWRRPAWAVGRRRIRGLHRDQVGAMGQGRGRAQGQAQDHSRQVGWGTGSRCRPVANCTTACALIAPPAARCSFLGMMKVAAKVVAEAIGVRPAGIIRSRRRPRTARSSRRGAGRPCVFGCVLCARRRGRERAAGGGEAKKVPASHLMWSSRLRFPDVEPMRAARRQPVS